MNTLKLSMLSATILATLGLTACGGGGGTASTGGTASPAGVASGAITGFGSVFVNGVEYKTGGASFSVNGASAGESQLKVGMVVTVDGTVDPGGKTGTATSVSFSDDMHGEVLAANVAANGTGTLNVMGQTVTLTASTQFDSQVTGITSAALIAVGNVVEVSGYTSGTGTVYATHIEVQRAAVQPGEDIEVKGVVQGLDSAASTFKIGGLTVNYANAQLNALPNGSLQNGLYVEVQSTSALSGTTMTADRVTLDGDGKPGIKGKEGEDAHLSGVVTAVSSSSQFDLNGQTVIIGSGTEFSHGSAAGITQGINLQVEGSLNSAGQLVASEIAFRERPSLELAAAVTAVDSAAGTVTVLGKTIQVNNNTITKDQQDANGQTPVRYFSLKNISTGDRVDINAYASSTGGALVATKLERINPSTAGIVQLEGTVSQTGTNQLTISGITVDTSGVSGVTVVAGNQVKVTGTFSGSTLVATTLSKS
ncbi:MAG: DUF5666 domain-containing protein [Gammaproteobacteria bacterium]